LVVDGIEKRVPHFERKHVVVGEVFKRSRSIASTKATPSASDSRTGCARALTEY
jgi:hypothetical protein